MNLIRSVIRSTPQGILRLSVVAALILPFVLLPQSKAHASAYADVVISEIMYDSASAGEENDEWVELYNSTSASIDLGGWVLTDDNTYPAVDEGTCTIPSGTSIAAGGFAVISRAALSALSIEIVCTPSGTYQLENGGDNLALFNTSGELVYGSLTFNYPDLADQNLGYSIGLKNPLAGWAYSTLTPANPYWIKETTPGTSPYVRHTAGALNSGWTDSITTPHTITVDGTVDTSTEWKAGELLGVADNATYYITWDNDDIFVGILGGNTASDKYNVLMDTDPFNTGAANTGTTGEYCGATFGANGKPNYALQVYPTGVSLAAANAGGTGWDPWSPSSGQTTGVRNSQVEFRIRKSDLGLSSSAPVGLYVYACNSSNRVWAAWPPENEINTSSVGTLSTRTVFDTTGPTRSPRDDAAHLGYDTHAAVSTGLVFFFDPGGAYSQNWHAHLNIATPGGAGCEVTMKVYANHAVSRLEGGVRRAYTITPNASCTGLAAYISLKYEDGINSNQAQTQTDVDQIPSELRGMDENSLTLYRYPDGGSAWNMLAFSATNRSSAHNRVVTVNAISQFSTWTFGYTDHAPTALTLSSLNAHPGTPDWLVTIALVGGALLAGSGLTILRRRIPSLER